MVYKAREVFGGYYERITEVHVDARLKLMPYAQCGVRFDDNVGVHFISYSTEVITVDPDGWLTCSGTYSQSTRKQIGRFLSEYYPHISYQLVKRLYETNQTINVHTMEIADLS